jgi:hypothetical protein
MDSPAERSPELDQVRRLLFPRLSATEGWTRIEWAIRGAADPQKQEAIEALAERDVLAALHPFGER